MSESATHADETVVLGVGNLLLGDDGVGIHVVLELEREIEELPTGVRLMDGGTFGLDLLPYLDGVRTLIIVDAVAHGADPGHIGVWNGEQVARIFNRPLSVHQAGVDALLGAMILDGSLPPEVWVVGVEPAFVEPGLELSGPVADAMPALKARVVQLAREVGTSALAQQAAPTGISSH